MAPKPNHFHGLERVRHDAAANDDLTGNAHADGIKAERTQTANRILHGQARFGWGEATDKPAFSEESGARGRPPHPNWIWPTGLRDATANAHWYFGFEFPPSGGRVAKDKAQLPEGRTPSSQHCFFARPRRRPGYDGRHANGQNQSLLNRLTSKRKTVSSLQFGHPRTNPRNRREIHEQRKSEMSGNRKSHLRVW